MINQLKAQWKATKVRWKPHPGPQTEALSRAEFEVLYGGARGGGKTEGGLAWLYRDTEHPKYRALVIRKNAKDLVDWIDRARWMFPHAEVVGNPPVVRFPSGAIIRTGHLRDSNAYTQYQGHEYQRMLIEELTQIPSEDDYLKLISSCRSSIPGLKPRVLGTTNPGGKGHAWVKNRFVSNQEWGKPSYYSEVIPRLGKVTRSRIFIPARVDDNPSLFNVDPGYILFLEKLKETNVDLWKAWRHGDWDVFTGQVFSEFRRDLHVIRPFVPHESYAHLFWADWGYSGQSAAAFYLSVVVPEIYNNVKFTRIITYKEWYGNQITPKNWASKIYQDAFAMNRVHSIKRGKGDPAMFNGPQDGSDSIADLMDQKWKQLHRKQWFPFTRGNNNRIGGWAAMHDWLSIAPDGHPYWLITENCKDLIRTLPALIYDEEKIEDVDTDMEDHGPDACRYGLTDIPFISGDVGLIPRGIIDRSRQSMPINDQGEPVSIDLNKFARAYPKGKKDWRSA